MDWQYLRCDCGGELFGQAVRMIWKAGGGAVPSPVGYVCLSCRAPLDMGKAARLLQKEEARKALQALEEQNG